jgi:hypothetical protein
MPYTGGSFAVSQVWGELALSGEGRGQRHSMPYTGVSFVVSRVGEVGRSAEGAVSAIPCRTSGTPLAGVDDVGWELGRGQRHSMPYIRTSFQGQMGVTTRSVHKAPYVCCQDLVRRM